MSPIDQNQRYNKPKIRLQYGPRYKLVEAQVRKHGLNTVCEEARCPNIYECWGRGTATIMILGNTCTRSCAFCSVKTGRPEYVDPTEPLRTARAVKSMNLSHIVITSVDRDDLKGDFGARHWAETITKVRELVPQCTIEVLTPDFQGSGKALEIVLETRPDIFSHNVECVARISKQVRSQAVWQRSLNVLKQSVESGILTKTGIMLGLGERPSEVVETMEEVAGLGVKIFTIGQYLQPTRQHLKVDRYADRAEFEEYGKIGQELGFLAVESGALVRSSYHADEQAKLFKFNGSDYA
ncbi:MAG: lipoyl synthase [Candidatus Neomarinimicrobiota bacterium]